MEKNTLIGIVLGILVLISVVQAFQMTSLRNQLSTGGGQGSGVQTAQGNQPLQSGGAAPSGGQPQLPSSLQNLPDMVGGC